MRSPQTPREGSRDSPAQTILQLATLCAWRSEQVELAAGGFYELESALHNESLYAAPLLDAARARGFTPQTCAMDKAYDNNRIYAECHERGCAAIIPLGNGQPERKLRIPAAARSGAASTGVAPLSSASSATLKHHFGLAFLRVRGIERVRLHADLVMLARLALALERTRALPATA